MQDKTAEQSAQLDADLTYRVRDIAMDVGLLMVAAIFTLLGGTGLLGHIIGVAYPLSGLMVPDAALAGFLAGIGLFGWLFHRKWLCYLAAAPLALITLYTLAHNVLAGGPWNGTSWVSGGPRILSAAAFLLFMVAVCVSIGTRQRWCRCIWAISGLLGLGAGSFSLLMMLLPANRLEWAEGFVSAPILATLYALLGGSAFIGAAWRGSRRLIPLGRLTQLAAIGGVIVSCLAWYILSWSAQSDLQRRAATLMDNAALDAQHTMQAQRELIQRLAWRQAMVNTLPTQGRWQQQTQPYFQHAPYIKALALLGPTGEVKEMSFSSQQKPSQLAQAISNSSLSEWLSTDWQAPWSLAVPGKPNTMLMVASLGDFADGLVAAELDVADLLEQALSVQLDHFRLTVGGDTPYLTMRQPTRETTGTPKRPLPHLETRHVGLPGGGLLTLDVHMDSVSGMLRAGMMPAGFAIAGLLLSYLLALTLGLFRMVLFRSRDLSAAQVRLAAQYDLEQRYRSLYLYHPDGVFSVDLEGRIATANEACSKITGRSNDDVIGHHFSALLRPQDTERLKSLFAITLNGQPTQVALEIIHRDGSLRSLDLTTMPIIVEGATQGVFGIAKDITQQHEQEAQLAYQATHDLLTGLPNRTALDESLEEAYEQAFQDNSLIVAMHLDLDGFKAVNDGLGYHIGNLLLAEVADRLRRVIGPYDTLARLTGDEFALLTSCLIGCAAAKTMANRMLDILSAPFHLEGKAIHISASIGIACNCESVEHAYELMQRADLAMADAKQKGRNTWQWYQGDELRITEDAVMLRHDLHEALQKEQFELYYQPIVEAISGRIRGFEALIRWHHPERGMISPGVFIPLAEQTGQIISLGRWIMHRVCQDTARHATMQARNAQVVPVALNISSLQFRREGFLQDIQQALTISGLPPEWLELEVTESVLLDGPEQAIELINTLKAMGIKVALDDFGTGFSSLSYLRDLPIHKVKLDRAFIKDITKDSRNAAIVQGIITMAHHMDLVVVAEGIEELDQQEDLIRRKCDLLQGFLFAKPMPLANVMALPEVLPSTHQN